MDYLDKSRKHIVVIFLLSSILFVTFCLVLYSQHKVAQLYSEDTLKSYETLRRIRMVEVNLLNLETGQRGYMLTHDSRFLEPYDRAQDALSNEIQIVEKMDLEESQRRRVKLIKERAALLDGALTKQLSVHSKMKSASANQVPDIEEFYANKQLMDSLRTDIRSFSENEKTRLYTHLSNLKNQQDEYLLTLMLGTIFAITALFIANAIIMTLINKGKKIENELRKTEERFSAVMNGVNDGIYDYDFAHGKAYYSPSYKKMLGFEDSEIANHPDSFKNLIHADDNEEAQQIVQDYMERKTPNYKSVFRMRHKNGGWRWILSRGVGIWDKDGKIERLMGSHTDISEQKEHEEELKQLNTDLENFTYVASHDLRSPLVNLKGFAGEIRYMLDISKPVINTAKEKMSPSDRTQFELAFEQEIPEALDYISAAVEKMDKLTSAILDLSKIGRRDLRKTVVNTQEIVENCIKALKYEIERKNVTLEIKNLPEVFTDSMSIEQAFGNIIDNAVKYMVPGKDGKIVIDSFNAGYYTIFTVQDNGRGIAENDHKRVFDFFRRAANTSDVSGNGMGMAFVKATIRKLGGNIWFESHLGEGTCFYFSIPKKT